MRPFQGYDRAQGSSSGPWGTAAGTPRERLGPQILGRRASASSLGTEREDFQPPSSSSLSSNAIDDLMRYTACVYGSIGEQSAEQYVVEVDNGSRTWVVYRSAADFKQLKKKAARLLSNYGRLSASYFLIPNSLAHSRGALPSSREYKDFLGTSAKAIACFEEFKSQCKRLRKDLDSERFPGYNWFSIDNGTDDARERSIYFFSIFLHVLMLRGVQILALFERLARFRRSQLDAGIKRGTGLMDAVTGGAGVQSLSMLSSSSAPLSEGLEHRFVLLNAIKEFLGVDDEADKEIEIFKRIRETMLHASIEDLPMETRAHSSSAPPAPRRDFQDYSFLSNISPSLGTGLFASHAEEGKSEKGGNFRSQLLEDLYDGETALYQGGLAGDQIDMVLRVLLRCIQRVSVGHSLGHKDRQQLNRQRARVEEQLVGLSMHGTSSDAEPKGIGDRSAAAARRTTAAEDVVVPEERMQLVGEEPKKEILLARTNSSLEAEEVEKTRREREKIEAAEDALEAKKDKEHQVEIYASLHRELTRLDPETAFALYSLIGVDEEEQSDVKKSLDNIVRTAWLITKAVAYDELLSAKRGEGATKEEADSTEEDDDDDGEAGDSQASSATSSEDEDDDEDSDEDQQNPYSFSAQRRI